MYKLISVLATLYFLSLILHLYVKQVAKKIPEDASLLFPQTDKEKVIKALYEKNDFELFFSTPDKIIIRTLAISRIIIVIGYLGYLLA